MNIYLHELKQQRKATLIWILSLSILIILLMMMYPTIQQDAESFLKLLENYPEELRLALGMHIESITSVLGFSAFVFSFTMLITTIQAMIMGMSIISKEERDKTADFLLTKPLSRTAIIINKIIASLTIFTITNISIYLVSLISITMFSNTTFDLMFFTEIFIGLLLTQILFFILGLFVSIIMKKVKSPLGVSLGIVFLLYTLSTILVKDTNDIMRYLTLYKYFEPNFIFMNKSLEAPFIILGLILVILLLTFSLIIYNKKDITS